MRIERELLKGVAPLIVLRLLGRRAMYGYELVEQVAERSEGLLELGQSTIYPLLYNLEAKGLIDAAWQAGDGSRERKYYRLTSKGRTRLARDQKQWDTLVQAVSNVFQNDVSRPEVAS
jgi:PadR family transcriptional regulator PadR